MNTEKLKQIIFLLERGYYDNKVIKYANDNKDVTVDKYELGDGEIIIYHDGWVCGYYNQNITSPSFGQKLLKRYRKEWISKQFPEIKELLNI